MSQAGEEIVLTEDDKIRVVYFANSLLDYCEDNLLLILRGLSPDIPDIADVIWSNAVKELACICCYLSIVDQNPTGQPTLTIEMLRCTFPAIDKLIFGDPSREILMTYEMFSGYEICPEAAQLVTQRLDSSVDQTRLKAELKAMLENSMPDRLGLLLQATSMPIEQAREELSARFTK